LEIAIESLQRYYFTHPNISQRAEKGVAVARQDCVADFAWKSGFGDMPDRTLQCPVVGAFQDYRGEPDCAYLNSPQWRTSTAYFDNIRVSPAICYCSRRKKS
jgi:hypothetical protein